MRLEKRFKLPPKEIRLVKFYANKEKIPQSFLVEQAIKEFLATLPL